MADVSEKFKTVFANNEKLNLSDAKGYQYFQKYLDSTSLLSLEERTLIKSMLPYLRDWYVQAGASAMNATDTQNRGAFMLGGTGSDNLTGGASADLLVGNAGDDTLQGGGGSDVLIGGTGNDTYKYNTGDGFDTILDRDGNGSIVMDGAAVSGGDQFGGKEVHRDANKRLYTDVGNGNLVIDGDILVMNWKAGNLGISMTDTPLADTIPSTSHDIKGDPLIHTDTVALGSDGSDWKISKVISTETVQGITLRTLEYFLIDADGNPTEGGQQEFDDILHGTGVADHIQAGGKRDFAYGNGGDDLIEGGAGADVLDGGDGNDHIYADSQISVAAAIDAGNTGGGSGGMGDWLSGGMGDDVLVGSNARRMMRQQKHGGSQHEHQ
jgi:Ca2+-binding RTX toxin-like protein